MYFPMKLYTISFNYKHYFITLYIIPPLITYKAFSLPIRKLPTVACHIIEYKDTYLFLLIKVNNNFEIGETTYISILIFFLFLYDNSYLDYIDAFYCRMQTMCTYTKNRKWKHIPSIIKYKADKNKPSIKYTLCVSKRWFIKQTSYPQHCYINALTSIKTTWAIKKCMKSSLTNKHKTQLIFIVFKNSNFYKFGLYVIVRRIIAWKSNSDFVSIEAYNTFCHFYSLFLLFFILFCDYLYDWK